MGTLSIGKLAKLTEVSIDTIRYYERQGLSAPPARRASGYRAYAPDVVGRLRFIRRAKGLSFTLGEITELLTLTAQSERDMAGMKVAARAKLGSSKTRFVNSSGSAKTSSGSRPPVRDTARSPNARSSMR